MSRLSCVFETLHLKRTYTTLTHPLRAWLTLPLAAMTLLPLPLTAHGAGRGFVFRCFFRQRSERLSKSADDSAAEINWRQAAAALRADTKLTPAQKQAKFALLRQSGRQRHDGDSHPAATRPDVEAAPD